MPSPSFKRQPAGSSGSPTSTGPCAVLLSQSCSLGSAGLPPRGRRRPAGLPPDRGGSARRAPAAGRPGARSGRNELCAHWDEVLPLIAGAASSRRESPSDWPQSPRSLPGGKVLREAPGKRPAVCLPDEDGDAGWLRQVAQRVGRDGVEPNDPAVQPLITRLWSCASAESRQPSPRRLFSLCGPAAGRAAKPPSASGSTPTLPPGLASSRPTTRRFRRRRSWRWSGRGSCRLRRTKQHDRDDRWRVSHVHFAWPRTPGRTVERRRWDVWDVGRASLTVGAAAWGAAVYLETACGLPVAIPTWA